jgi:hypothetical protein
MKFIGKVEYLSPKVLKTGRRKVSYYRVPVVSEKGKIENIALTPIEYKKARKRAQGGILYQRPTVFMRLYAALLVLFG